MTRSIDKVYRDPLDLIWLHAACALGLRVVRSGEVYAAYDGKGTLTLADAASCDADDSLGQYIFHELCHALVEAEVGWSRPDWGLDNIGDGDLVREHAALRLQAELAKRYGLRDFFATTTDFRAYYDALPSEPLADDGDPAVPIAQRAVARAAEPRYAEVIFPALERTRVLRELVGELAPADSLWRRGLSE